MTYTYSASFFRNSWNAFTTFSLGTDLFRRSPGMAPAWKYKTSGCNFNAFASCSIITGELGLRLSCSISLRYCAVIDAPSSL